MAKQTGNVVTYGLSGKVGDLLVFRRRITHDAIKHADDADFTDFVVVVQSNTALSVIVSAAKQSIFGQQMR